MPQSLDRSLVRRTTRHSQRITKEHVVQLKEKSEPKGIASIFRGIGNLFMHIGTIISPGAPIKSARKCKKLGHVMPASGWQVGSNPLCVDCGKRINDPTEIRDSVWKI